MKRLLLIGGGHAHVEVLRRFALRPEPGVAITLVSPHRQTPYSGMLPGLVAGHYTFDQSHIDLAPLARWAGAALLATRVERLDAQARIAHCADGSAQAFDVCGIDIGSTPGMEVPGAREHALGVKPVERFLACWAEELEHARHGTRKDIAIVGGGAGGLEILLALQHAARAAIDEPADQPRFHLLTDTPSILPSHAPVVRRLFEEVLGRRGVAVHAGARVIAVEPGLLRCAGGAEVRADLIVWATSASAAPWIRESGLAVDDKGFMLVDRHLESVSHRRMFGSGDIAALQSRKLPKSGVFAVRKGPVLAHNLRAALRDKPLLPFITKSSALGLITTGDRYAVMAWGRFALAGKWVWRWKDFIDRRFMAKYRRPGAGG
ncbi:MAG: FAD-dependent oxidoreductase [Burkholderiales bacterium]|nr:FAD-dependent oxidoreductase [Burkholderiales bacterium]